MLTINTKIVNVGAKSLKIKETPTAKLTAYFERPNDYNGEFGFDWYRNYFSTKLADPTKLEALKNEYTPTIINDEDYYVPWLALKKDKTATLKLKIVIKEDIKGKQKDDFIKMPEHNSLIFEPAEIKLSELKKKQEFDIKITCKRVLYSDTKLSITLKTSQKEVGRLNVLKNSKPHEIKIRFVKVIAYPNKGYFKKNDSVENYKWVDKQYDSEQEYLSAMIAKNHIIDFIQNKTFNQALINIEIDPKDYTIVLDGKTLQNEGKLDGYTIKDKAYANKFLRSIFNIYIEAYEKTQKTKDIIIFTTALQKTDNNNLISGEGSLYNASDRFCIMYDAGLDQPASYVHELGHVLGCEHSFVDIPDKWVQAMEKAQKKINDNNENINDGDVKITSYNKEITNINSKISTFKSKLELMKQSNSATAKKNIITLIKNIETLNKNISKYKAAIENKKANNEIYKQRVLNAEKKLVELTNIKEKNPYRFFNKGTTSNFMDYSGNMNDFYKWQWMTMQEDVEKYYNKVDL